ncbi:MAG: glycosyltransferase family 4 protein [Candidatus Sungbacteria bacterium]|nr:glycosyltransferase family 4 protein [Candidatus Sungbacteria bacterium]
MTSPVSKNLFLLFHGRFPSEKAASLFVAKSCEAFAGKGMQVTLLVPRRIGRSKEDARTYYRLQHHFDVVFLPTLDLSSLLPFKKITFLIDFIFFSLRGFLFLSVHAKSRDVIYSNETLPLLLASFRFPRTFFELHDFPEQHLWLHHTLLRRCKWILVHKQWKVDDLSRLFSLDPSKIMYRPNAVDMALFDVSTTTAEARSALQLPLDRRTIVYTGSLFGWKGVDTLAQAARNLGEAYNVVFVGGNGTDREQFRARYGAIPNITIVGYRPYAEIPLWQKAADVLVLPNTGKEEISRLYTSPMKLFEYMASRRPIVASDIPSVTEIANTSNAVLAEPDNPEALAKAIKDIFVDPCRANLLAQKAFQDVGAYTWEKRASAIIAFMYGEPSSAVSL